MSENAKSYKNYKVYARTVHGSTLKTTVESLKESFEEIPIRFSREEGITIHALGDHGRAIGSVLKLDTSLFDEFYIDENEDDVVVAIDITLFNLTLKSCSNNEVVTISITHDNQHSVFVTRYDEKHNKSKTFGINTLEIDDEDGSKARLVLENKLKQNIAQESYDIPCSVFVQACKDALLIKSEYIELCTQGNSFIFSAKDMNQLMYYEEKIDMKNKDNIETTTDVRSHRYSLINLNAFNKCAVLSEEVSIKIGTRGELVMEYLIDSNSSSNSYSFIVFMMMPIKESPTHRKKSGGRVEDSDYEA